MGGPTNYLVYPTRVEVELGCGCGWAVTIAMITTIMDHRLVLLFKKLWEVFLITLVWISPWMSGLHFWTSALILLRYHH